MDLSRMSATEKQILIFSFYRDAELRGARLLFNLLGRIQDPDAQLKMSKHLSDETRHTLLWTKSIAYFVVSPLSVEDLYLRRLVLQIHLLMHIDDHLLLTVLFEERTLIFYTAL